jgi:uncharacterized protein YbaP (TraB family)
MRKNYRKLFVIFSVSILWGSFIYIPEGDCQTPKSFLWRVRSAKNTVHVLGSLHLAKKEIYPLSQKVENAFEQAEILVVEANVNDMRKMDAQKLMERAFYPPPDTLEKHVSIETYGWVKKEARGLGISIELIDKQKPWFLSMTLVALEGLRLGLDPDLGIDKYFLSKAEGKKKIVELESLDDQIDLLSNFSDKDQELFLIYTLKDLNIMEQEVSELTQAWTRGDTKGMESILTRSLSEDKRLFPIFEKLIYERNRKMVSKIEDFLKTKETYLVIIGAGHLVGNQGVIEILKGKGYLVEQL